jgi:hypothetical protein
MQATTDAAAATTSTCANVTASVAASPKNIERRLTLCLLRNHMAAVAVW